MDKKTLTTTEEIRSYFDNKCGETIYNCYLKFKGNDYLSDVLFHTYKVDVPRQKDYVYIVALPGLPIDNDIIRYVKDYSEGHVVYEVKLTEIENIHFKKI